MGSRRHLPSLLTIALLAAGLFSCARPPSDDENSAGEDSGDCSIGSEGCSCTEGGSCDPGLDCLSGICVDAGEYGDGGDDNGGDDDEDDDDEDGDDSGDSGDDGGSESGNGGDGGGEPGGMTSEGEEGSETTSGGDSGVDDSGDFGDTGTPVMNPGCGWHAYGYYDCSAEKDTTDPSGMYPISCPEGVSLTEGASCDGVAPGLTIYGCCDANGDNWYCDSTTGVITKITCD